ncbi:lysophospholipid acyltransferase family protein [[Actinomadura] parvosata]|uniref:lysophospholipid acyltransferase family protein n=1 Tax=[Actinomadura] parvosata TaxID=1955412 RepID=UPI00406D0365
MNVRSSRRVMVRRQLSMTVLQTVLRLAVRRHYAGLGHIPGDGGVIIVANHVSKLDSLAIAAFVGAAGRWPRFLAKAPLFDIPVVGRFLISMRQIPVNRGGANAADALAVAAAAVRAGDVVIIYPEGGTPKPWETPLNKGKTGAARLWLSTGAPVVPVVSWGPQNILDPATGRLRLRPRTPVIVVAGPPLELSSVPVRSASARSAAVSNGNGADLHGITEEIMRALRSMAAGAAEAGALFPRRSVARDVRNRP